MKKSRIVSLTPAGLLSLTFLLLLSGFLLLTGCTGEEAQEAEAAVQPEETLTPLPASQIADGSYEITVTSSASMFRVVHCVLTVEGDRMTATMTMSGQGYGYVFPGTGEEALQADPAQYIPFVLDETGAKTFALPIEALNQEVPCAAWSIKKEKWYDRTLVFSSDALPPEALTDTNASGANALDANALADGNYLVDVTLSGGTGRVQVTSPTVLTVAGDSLTALVVLDSPYFTLMQVGAFQYNPVETGNEATSAFDIPVVLDEALSIQAQTIAMSQPHLIDYTLYFDSTTLRDVPASVSSGAQSG